MFGMDDTEKDKKLVIVHIGPHKTGSTAIQRCFSANRGALSRADVLFLHDSTTHEASKYLGKSSSTAFRYALKRSGNYQGYHWIINNQLEK